jgi:P-type Ca2+ transporter type 2B
MALHSLELNQKISQLRQMSFAFSRDQLKQIIRDRDTESMSVISATGGVKRVALGLDVDPDLGIVLGRTSMDARTNAFGVNYVPPPKPRSYLSFLKDAFGDLTIIILCAAAFVELGIAIGYAHSSTSYAESTAILVSILVVTNVAASNDYRKQAQFRKLNATVENVAITVIRGGQKVTIPSNDIVVGDIVTLSIGDVLCADGLLIDGHGVETDESSLTGETKNISKSVDGNPFLLSGTKVMDGAGTFLVIAVGENSEAGQIRMIVQGGRSAKSTTETTETEPEIDLEQKSVLTSKLDDLATNIGKAGTLVALICFLVMTIRFSITTFGITNSSLTCTIVENSACTAGVYGEIAPCAPDGTIPPNHTSCCLEQASRLIVLGSPCPWFPSYVGEYIGFFITAITILVVAVPEGLPLAVTLSLAFSVMKMQKDNNLVKHLDACETMGSATTICSDKTGTLTKNRMTVMRAYIGGQNYRSMGSMPVGYAVLGLVESQYRRQPPSSATSTARRKSIASQKPLLTLFAEAVAINSTGDIKWDERTKLFDQMGNKTECALLQFIFDFGFNYAEIRNERKSDIVEIFPFNSTKKMSSCIIKSGTELRLHVKGASEMVLDLCSHGMMMDGEVRQLSREDRQHIEKKISEYASNAMRTICVATKIIPEAVENIDGLTILAIVGIEDPIRDEVPESIRICRSAGIDVRMVTGDNIETAIAIAKNCGILRKQDLDHRGHAKPLTAMTGPDFRRRVVENGKINMEEFDKIWPHLRVLARSSPTDKFTLVSGLIESDLFASNRAKFLNIYPDKQVVAVTGDGTNDAPALKKADVGFAMGITGTQVAKEAADIILLDDNFSSIVKACMWGRNIHESISKFIQFQITINVVALVLAIEGSLAFSESPLRAVQMLWVNLIMDSLASLSLATEMPTMEHLERPPIGRNRSMISPTMVWNILGHAIYQLTVLNILLFLGPDIFGYPNGSNLGKEAPPTEHYTSIFNCFVFMQLFNQFNSRKIHHETNLFGGLWSRGKFFLLIALVEFGGQIVLVLFGGSFFSTTPISWQSWILALVLGFLVFPVQYIIIFVRTTSRRLCPRRGNHRNGPGPQVLDTGVQVTARLNKGNSHDSLNSSNGTGDNLVATNLILTKRNETSTTLTKGLSRKGKENSRKELAKASIEYQRARRNSPRPT